MGGCGGFRVWVGVFVWGRAKVCVRMSERFAR